ncbi:MAG: type II secretion system GspH family protein [Clostridia bacterium]|nr:type II secretion system GspH family protein [Clostridia bacterium]
MQKIFKSNKRGFTLYELIIVMAITAVAGTLIVGFILFINNQAKRAQGYSGAMSEISALRLSVERWFSRYDNNEYEFISVGGTLTASGNNGYEYSVYLKDNAVYLEYDSGSEYGSYDSDAGCNVLSLSAQYITSVSFEYNGGTLYKCIACSDYGDTTFLLEVHVQ